MPDLHARTRSKPGAAAWRWLERGLIAAGAAALIVCGVFVADLLIAQRAARDAVRTAVPNGQPLVAPALEEVGAPVPAAPAPDSGSAIALLSIPRIGLSAAVLHGSDAKTLRRAPGHLEHTAYPGEAGNAVIAGHRDTFFRPLRHIRVGDDIFVNASTGRFHYQVTSLRVVHPRDVSVLAATDDAVLTLITCYPFWVLGQAPDRFVVRAARVDAPSPPPLEVRTLPPWPPLAEVPVLTAPAAVRPEVDAEEDDEGLIRLAVRRYLLLHGAQLTCEVAIGEEQATADCGPVTDPSAEDAPQGRTFMLERSAGAWAIRSIVLK
jgi:LPXTG-site transpeptidase (sortase) family protein